jgi:bifunctional non-homologous end joining protein LigD
MLASTTDHLPQGPAWIYEFKWDGVRALIDIRNGRATIRSRRGNDVTISYPELARLGDGIDDALVDGEIVTFADGRPSFGLLQTRMHVRSARQAAQLATDAPASFIAFDLLRLYGVDVTSRPLAERRATLIRLLTDRPGWTVSPAFDDGAATETAARQHGLEGVVAKRVESPYRAGVRGPDWIKMRFLRRGEFIVVGWESDAAKPNVLSSLLLGYHDGALLAFAGKVGSGLTERSAAMFQRRLRSRRDRPVHEDVVPSPGRIVTWVEPEVVVEVSYSEWAPDGRLRQPVFLGERTDKDVSEVVGDA